MSMPVLDLVGVGHRYPIGGAASRRHVEVLRRIDLSVERGQILGIAGGSGSGKSTLLRLAAALERPTTGIVRADDVNVWARGRRPTLPRSGWASAVFQDPAGSLDPSWTVQRILDEPFHARHRSVARDERRRRVEDVLGQVGLDGLPLHLRPTQLSGGQQQRVALARSYLAEPTLLIADEPTSALDVTNSASVMRLLRQLADRGTAILLVSHDLRMLRAVADAIYLCCDGGLERIPESQTDAADHTNSRHH